MINITSSHLKPTYPKHPQISRTFFQKSSLEIGDAGGTFGKGAIHFHELTLLWKPSLTDPLSHNLHHTNQIRINKCCNVDLPSEA